MKNPYPTSINIPLDLLEEIDNYAQSHFMDRTGVVLLASREFILRLKNPEIVKEQIRHALREDPTILKEVIDEQVRDQVQTQLRQILGEKHQP